MDIAKDIGNIVKGLLITILALTLLEIAHFYGL